MIFMGLGQAQDLTALTAQVAVFTDILATSLNEGKRSIVMLALVTHPPTPSSRRRCPNSVKVESHGRISLVQPLAVP